MSPTKTELEAENRQLRKLVGEVYDRVADHIEPRVPEDQDADADEEDDYDEDEDADDE
ncbi:MAG: hypothetical protein M3P26_10465 [Gemmatimonadota bacterium]|nr:hypothetical protein [Gemmatimonadota bacterium]